MTLKVVWTNKFKKDYKLAMQRGLNIKKLDDIIIKLANGEILPTINRDHNLSNNYKGFRECHIEPDWLLIYAKTESELILTLARTGTHSDLFNK